MAGNAGSFKDGTTFDLNTQQGIVAVLAAVRSSDLSPTKKNDLRDLIFLYTNGGGDKEMKSQLETILADLQPAQAGAPVSSGGNEVVAEQAQQGGGIGHTRLAPQFQVITREVKAAAVPPPTPPPSVAVPATSQAPTPPPESPQTKTVPTPAVTSAAPVPDQTTGPSVSDSDTVSPVVATPKTSTEQSAAPRQTTPTPTGITGGVSSQSPHLVRIREIKAEVNQQVGNPVNLVDIDNAVGREYMNALLGAMKKINGGTETEVVTAMRRLEEAFVTVKRVVAERGVTPAASTTPATPPPGQPVAASQQPVDMPPQAVPTEKTTAPITPASPATVVPGSQPPLAAQPVSPPTRPADTTSPPPVEAPMSLADELRWKRGASAPLRTTPPATPTAPTAPASSAFSTPTPDPAAAPTPTPAMGAMPAAPGAAASPTPFSAPASTPQPLSSVAASGKELTEQLQSELQRAEAAANEKKHDSLDPLMTTEISNHLDSLLSEWSLFKSSGFFGTGPNGREHPLYLKLANLPITHILAGRYEGAKPEIKQSITDYMNGWRYEQGVIYEQDETFEHYLRRVIRHIIDQRQA